VFVAQYAGRLAADQTFFDQNNLPPGFVMIGVPQSDYSNDRSFSNVSPRLGFDFRVTDDLLAYISYSEGFKSGGFDMRGNALANPDTRNGYDAETADNYEIGMKSTWLDGTLQLNLTGFYTPYRDVQITTQEFVVVNGIPTNVTAVLNAGKAVNKGVELESIWQPVSALTLALNVGWLDAQFDVFDQGCNPAVPAPGLPLCNPQTNTRNIASLNEPINAPDWTSFFGATYRWELGVGDLAAHLGYQYRSKTKVANTTLSITDQDAYDILDLGVSYTTANQAWRFALEGKNVLDEEYRVAGYDFGNTNISQIGFYGPPRTVAVSATYRY
jgi:iron complex outermembrane receptor protein